MAAVVIEASEPSAGVTPEPLRPEAPLQVVLDVSPADSSIVPLLRAELHALGVEVDDGTEAAPETVTIHVVLAPESLGVQIVDRRAGHGTVQETFPVASGTSMDPRMAVLHVVELLRWHLRFNPASDAARATSAPSVETKSAATSGPAQMSDIRIGLASFAAYSPGGTSLGLGGQVDVLRRWRRLGARLLGGTVLIPNRISVPAGSLEVTASWAGLEGVLILAGDRATSVEVGAGGSIFVSGLQGTGSAGNIGRGDHVVTFSPFADLRLRRRISPGFGLNVDSALLVPLQSSRLLAVGNEVGRYGRIVLTFGIGAELAIF